MGSSNSWTKIKKPVGENRPCFILRMVMCVVSKSELEEWQPSSLAVQVLRTSLMKHCSSSVSLMCSALQLQFFLPPGPASPLWSPPPTRSDGVRFIRAQQRQISLSSPSHRHPGVPSASSPASSQSHQCRTSYNCRECDARHRSGNLSFTLVRRSRRAMLDLKTVLMPNFLHTGQSSGQV